MIEEYIKEENEMTEIEKLKERIRDLEEEYQAMLRLHNTTAEAARSEECGRRVEARRISALPKAEQDHLARRCGREPVE